MQVNTSIDFGEFSVIDYFFCFLPLLFLILLLVCCMCHRVCEAPPIFLELFS